MSSESDTIDKLVKNAMKLIRAHTMNYGKDPTSILVGREEQQILMLLEQRLMNQGWPTGSYHEYSVLGLAVKRIDKDSHLSVV